MIPARKPARGGKRPGAGRKRTTGQSPLLSVRISRETMRACEEAAALEGLSLPDWVRARLDPRGAIAGF